MPTGPDIKTSYSYDSSGNLVETKNLFLDRITRYSYDEDNNLIQVEYPDGKIDRMAYDSNGQLMEVINNDSSKTILTRNERGEIIAVTDEENRTVFIDRDIMGRVIKETSPSGRTVSYEYGGSGCQSCGGDLKLTKITDPGNNIWEFKYDIMSNATEMIYPDGTRIKQDYDFANRLIQFTNKRNQSIHYQPGIKNVTREQSLKTTSQNP